MRFSSGDHKNPNDHGTPSDRGKLAPREIVLLCETIDAFLDTVQLHASLIHGGTDSSATGSIHDEWFETGVPTFDELGVCEQLAVLRSISLSLVTKRTLGRSQSSLRDAAIAVLIGCVRANVEMELDCDDSDSDDSDSDDPIDDDHQFVTWRQKIRDAASVYVDDPLSVEFDRAFRLLPASDTDLEKWSQLIDRLAERWLPDRDFELADLFLDADPDQAMVVKEQLGIHHNYFVDTVDEPAPEDFDDWLNETRQLVRRKPR